MAKILLAGPIHDAAMARIEACSDIDCELLERPGEDDLIAKNADAVDGKLDFYFVVNGEAVGAGL